jgi:hypothetical protein
MDMVAKKCDICGTVEGGRSLDSWFGFTQISDDVYTGGKLRSVRALKTSGEVIECCGMACAIKAASNLHSEAMSPRQPVAGQFAFLEAV